MAIAIDAETDSGVFAAVTSVTFSHTVGAALSNSILIVPVMVRDTSNTDMTITGVTYNGVAMTKIRSATYYVTGRVRVEFWYLLNPAAGAHNVVVSFTGTCDTGIAEAISLSGVDQTFPILDSDGLAGSTNAPSLDLGIYVSGAWIIDALYTKTNEVITAGGSQTDRMNAAPNAGGDKAGVSTKEGLSVGETTVSWSWTTNDDTAYGAIVLRPASGASGDIDLLLKDSVRGSGTSITRSMTIPSGNNRVLVVGTTAQDSNHANMPVTGITWNGVALTKVRHDEPAGNVRTEIWYLIAPDTGTHDLVVSYTGTLGEVTLQAAVLSGADQSAPIEANNGASGTAADPTLSVTSVTNNAWFFSILAHEDQIVGSTQHEISSTPLRDQTYENSQGGLRPRKATAGALTQKYYTGSSQAYALSGCAIKPASAVTTAVKDPIGVGVVPFAR